MNDWKNNPHASEIAARPPESGQTMSFDQAYHAAHRNLDDMASYQANLEVKSRHQQEEIARLRERKESLAQDIENFRAVCADRDREIERLQNENSRFAGEFAALHKISVEQVYELSRLCREIEDLHAINAGLRLALVESGQDHTSSFTLKTIAELAPGDFVELEQISSGWCRMEVLAHDKETRRITFGRPWGQRVPAANAFFTPAMLTTADVFDLTYVDGDTPRYRVYSC